MSTTGSETTTINNNSLNTPVNEDADTIHHRDRVYAYVYTMTTDNCPSNSCTGKLNGLGFHRKTCCYAFKCKECEKCFISRMIPDSILRKYIDDEEEKEEEPKREKAGKEKTEKGYFPEDDDDIAFEFTIPKFMHMHVTDGDLTFNNFEE